MNLLFVGITNHHHIQNFSKSIKKNLGYKLYAININPNYINNKSEDGLFEKELLVTRSDSHLKDTLSKIVTSMKAIISIKEKIDIVQFHLISLYTLPLAIIAKCKGMKVSSFVWGSEFLRANKLMRMYFYFVFKISNSVVCDSTSLCEKMRETYPTLKKRINCVQFGSSVIDDLLKSEKSNMVLNDKIVIMCGYNGSNDQKHLDIIDVLSSFHNRVYFIIPMTYACDDDYRREVRERVNKYGFEYIILDHFIEGQEWENYLLSTDIFIHMQSTDSFSSSVAEHLLLGNVVINGEWLEYEDLEKEGVYYVKSDITSLYEKVDNIINNLSYYRRLCENNKEKIIKLKSLDYCVNHYWKPYFEEI